MRNIYIYKDETESRVQQFFENADEKLRNKFKSILNYLSNDKNPLCEPYVKHISIVRYRELYEIRMKALGNMVRVLFVKQGEDIVLLYAFYKRSGKDTEKALDIAFKLLNRMRENGVEMVKIKAAEKYLTLQPNRQKQAQTECAFYANLVWAFVIICKIYEKNAI